MIKLIVADDEVLFREVLVAFLERDEDFRITGSAGNGNEVMELLLKEKPDVIVTDIRMPEMNGVELTKEVLAAYPDLPIIGLTMYEDDHLVADMFQAGAKGYLIKRSTKDLKEAIKVVYNKGYYFCETTSVKLAKMLAASQIQPFQPIAPGLLSEKDIQIIRLTCEGMSTKEMAPILFLGKRTIDTYRAALYQKIGVKGLADLIIFAIRYGIYKP